MTTAIKFQDLRPTEKLIKELDNAIVNDPGQLSYYLGGIIAVCNYGAWKFFKGAY